MLFISDRNIQIKFFSINPYFQKEGKKGNWFLCLLFLEVFHSALFKKGREGCAEKHIPLSSEKD
jgi:hypothetical protein